MPAMASGGWRTGRTGRTAAARVLVAGLVIGLAACGGGGSPDSTLEGTRPIGEGVDAPVDPTPGATAVPGPGALTPKEVLTATRDAVVFITTPTGSGSGVLLPSGHVVTSAHVVQPFAEVTLTFADGATISRAPVTGVDGWTDIAVVGPVTTDAPRLALGSDEPLEQGDPIYLVGYPSETDEQPTPTITSGILSRIRAVPEFGLTYLQTDATIAGGQSGGALVDQRGRVVGITGFSVEGFSVAVQADDVDESVRAIVDGKGSSYRTLPQGAAAPTGTVRLDDSRPTRQLYLPASTAERPVSLALPAGVPFVAYDLFEFTDVATNALAEEAFIATLPADQQAEARADLGPVVTPDAEGRYAFTVPADVYLIVRLGPFADVAPPRDVTYAMDPAPVVVEGLDPVRPITPGTELEGVLNEFDNEHLFSLDLRQGQRVALELVAPAGALGYSIDGPGVDPTGDTDGSYQEATESAFAGSLAAGEFVAPADGRFTLYVFNADYLLVSYRLSIT